MQPTARIHMIRHGEVEPPWATRLYGALDVPLSERGREQSREVAGRFRQLTLASVVSSGLERAEFAAALLRADRDLERRDDARLAERSRGAWAGLARDEVNRAQPGAWEELRRSEGILTPPGGETLEEVQARVLPALAELARAHAGQSLVVVAHLWVTRVALCHTLGMPLEHCARLAIGHCQVATIDWPSSDWPASDWPSSDWPANTWPANGMAGERPVLVGLGPGPHIPDRRSLGGLPPGDSSG